jgi:hypothetical protein
VKIHAASVVRKIIISKTTDLIIIKNRFPGKLFPRGGFTPFSGRGWGEELHGRSFHY